MYGSTGRIVAAIAAFVGVVSAFAAAAQTSGIYSILPPKYAWIATVLPIVSLFLVSFSERIQGGASDPLVREAAKQSDLKNERQELADSIPTKRPSDTLKPMIAALLAGTLSLSLISCGGGGVLRSFRAALEASPALVSSLVNAHVITQAQATAVIQDFKDGADVALQLEADFKLIPKDAPDAKARKLSAAVKAMRGWRAIVNRRNFQVSVRLTQAADIADGILSSLVVFYSESGPMLNSAQARATVTSVADEKELEQRLGTEVEKLKTALKP